MARSKRLVVVSRCAGVGAIVAGLALASCGEGDPPDVTQPPNTFQTATVKEIKVETRTSKLFGEISKSYGIRFVADNGENWFGSVGSHRVNEDDLRGIIGRSVSFSCWREPAYGRTCHYLRSLTSGGRELIKPGR